MNKQMPIFKLGQRVIGTVFGLLFGLTTLFALTSPNLIVGDNDRTGAGTTIVTAFVIIAIATVCILLYVYPSVRKLATKVFVTNAKLTASLLLAAVVVWQVVFVTALHPPIGWDAAALHQALIDPTSSNMRGYYSQNFNNIPIVLVMHWLATGLHSTSWLTFDYITLALVDFSALFNLLTVAVVAKHRLPAAIYIHAVWLALFPTIIVPYTDAWVLPVVSLCFLSYAVLVHSKWAWGWRLPAAATLGLAAVAAYYLKPSAIVPMIAMAAVAVLFAFKSKGQRRWSQLLATLAVLIAVGGGSYQVLGKAIHNQDYIQIIPGREIPAVHFMNMGVSGEGGYNPDDALMMAVLPTKQARSDYATASLKKRLKQLGPLGYAQFLFKKHRNNTADGSFAWVKEGSFIDENPKPKPGPGLKNHLQQFIYLYGTNLGDFRWLSQLTWVIGLLLIAFGWEDHRRFTQVLRVTVIGAFMYLLLFEGGRTRYLIQYLPAILLLITMVGDRSIARWRRLFSWGQESSPAGGSAAHQA